MSDRRADRCVAALRPVDQEVAMKDGKLHIPPMPVVVLTLLAIGLGATTMALGLALLGISSLAFLVSATTDTGIMATIVGAAQLVVGVAALVLAFGLWFQRSWAWGLGLVVFGLSLVVSVASVAAGATIGSVALLIAVALLVLWYLYQPRVKTLYGH
jgi:uncharacterized membrane protein (DUF2068 family)